MAMSEDFTSKIVNVVILVVIIGAVAIPICTDVGKDMTGTTKTIFDILPVFLVLALLLLIVRWFMNGRNKE